MIDPGFEARIQQQPYYSIEAKELMDNEDARARRLIMRIDDSREALDKAQKLIAHTPRHWAIENQKKLIQAQKIEEVFKRD